VGADHIGIVSRPLHPTAENFDSMTTGHSFMAAKANVLELFDEKSSSAG
jgi:hypothetical protein